MNHSGCQHRIIDGIEEHIVAAWPEGALFAATRDLVNALIAYDPERWGPSCCYRNGLTPQRMGRYLYNHLGIKSGKNGDDVRGYHLEDFWEAPHGTSPSR